MEKVKASKYGCSVLQELRAYAPKLSPWDFLADLKYDVVDDLPMLQWESENTFSSPAYELEMIEVTSEAADMIRFYAADMMPYWEDCPWQWGEDPCGVREALGLSR